MRLKTRSQTAATTLVLLLMALLMADSAGAQFQYSAPGGPEEQPANRRETLELEVTRAGYRLGPLRVAPWATVRDVAYVRPIVNSISEPPPPDFTATVGAGFRAYLRNGPKATWTLGVLPEYVWWHKQSERRNLNGRYLVGFHGFFNRLTLEATAGREQALQIVTPEVPVLASARTDKAEILTEVELTPALFAFASGSARKQANLLDDTQDPLLRSLRLLDRRERVARGGLRWQPRRTLSLGLGVESSRVDFDRTAVKRSNSGTSPLAQFSYSGRRLGLNAEVAFRSLEAREGSEFVPYSKPTGSVVLNLGSGRTLGATVYATRNLIYALASGYAYLQDDRLGIVVVGNFGRRASLRGFVETGADDYSAFAAGTPRRRDDVTSYGGGFDFYATDELSVGFKALRSRFVPNLPGDDRTYTSAGVTVNFGGH